MSSRNEEENAEEVKKQLNLFFYIICVVFRAANFVVVRALSAEVVIEAVEADSVDTAVAE